MKKQKTLPQGKLDVRLNRETLRRLSEKEAAQAVGASLDPCASGSPGPCHIT